MVIDKEKKALVLDAPYDQLVYKEWTTFLEGAYTKNELCLIIDWLNRRLEGYTVRMSNEQWQLRLGEVARKRNSSSKDTLVNFLAKLFTAPANRRIVFDFLTEGQRKAWAEIYTRIYITSQDAEAIIGLPVIKEEKTKHSYYYYYQSTKELSPMAVWMKYINFGRWSSEEDMMYLPASVRKFFREFFEEEAHKQIKYNLTNILTEDDTTIRPEAETLAVIPVLDNLIESRQLERGKFKVTQTMVNRAAKSLALPEFYPDSSEKTEKNLRASYLVNGLMAYYRTVVTKDTKGDTPAIVKGLVNELLTNPFNMYGTILSFLDRSTARLFDRTYLRPVIETVKNFLTEHPGGTERTGEELYNTIYNMRDINNTVRVISNEACEATRLSNERSGKRINTSTMMWHATIPAALAVVGILCAWGVLDITYRQAKQKAPSPFSGIKSIKVNPLGEYAFGMTNEYVFTPADNSKLFELDDTKLIILALGDTNPYEASLTNFAKPIGARRYAVTPGTFLATCSKLSDIENKVKSFKRLICSDLPKNWADFFTGLINNCDKVSDTDGAYVVKSIDPDDRRLHELIFTDPELKKYAVPAQNYLLLVETKKFDAFKKRLLALGYLI